MKGLYMSWKTIFPRNELTIILLKRGYVFGVDEGFQPMLNKIGQAKKWQENRRLGQEDLLKLIKIRPSLFDFIYKLLDFVIKDRKNFRTKCTYGADNQESVVWEHNHREDKLEDLKKTRREKRMSRAEQKEILKFFFLAMPELFLKDYRKDGKDFFVFPREEDGLYFLSSSQAHLSDLYEGLKKENSLFLEAWQKLLF
jgi:hypothetical protein